MQDQVSSYSRHSTNTAERQSVPRSPSPWDAGPCEAEISRLVLLVQTEAEKASLKANHVVETRQLPRDLLRNAEILEDYATRLQTHARQIIRRALGSQL